MLQLNASSVEMEILKVQILSEICENLLHHTFICNNRFFFLGFLLKIIQQKQTFSTIHFEPSNKYFSLQEFSFRTTGRKVKRLVNAWRNKRINYPLAKNKKKSFLQDVKCVLNPRSRTRCSKFYLWDLTLLWKSLAKKFISAMKSFSSRNSSDTRSLLVQNPRFWSKHKII